MKPIEYKGGQLLEIANKRDVFTFYWFNQMMSKMIYQSEVDIHFARVETVTWSWECDLLSGNQTQVVRVGRSSVDHGCRTSVSEVS